MAMTSVLLPDISYWIQIVKSFLEATLLLCFCQLTLKKILRNENEILAKRTCMLDCMRCSPIFYKLGVGQSLVVFPLTSIVVALLHWDHVDDRNERIVGTKAVTMISLTVAVMYLFFLYRKTRKVLPLFEPGLKFSAIKLAPSVPNIQSFILSLISAAGFISDTYSIYLHNTLICCECLIFSFLFFWVFHPIEIQKEINSENIQEIQLKIENNEIQKISSVNTQETKKIIGEKQEK